MGSALETLAELAGGHRGALVFPWDQLRPERTSALRAALAERFAPSTANRHLAALRGVLREAWRCGLISAEERDRASDLPPVRGERLPRGRALEAAELRQLFEACADGSALGARDAAAFALLFGAGLRRAEAVGLDLADVDVDTGALRVLGKGAKERVAYLPAGGRAALAGWLRHRGDADGPLLQPVNRGGKIIPRRMTAQSLRPICQRRGRRAGISDFSPHDLRRSFVGAALDAGADLSAVQKLAGHASVQTTARYDRRPERAKRRSAELLHVPFNDKTSAS
jgi:site-specific recombinase XerD